MSSVDTQSPAPSPQPLFVANLDELLPSAPKRRFAVVGPLPVSGKYVRIRSLFENESVAASRQRHQRVGLFAGQGRRAGPRV